MTALYLMRLIGLCVFVFGISLYSKADADFSPPPSLPDAEKLQFDQWVEVAQTKGEDKVFAKAKGAHLNALVNSASPYLRQHAKNPVNWKPWRNEFLEKAQSENKLIFLSIGYSTCHWCHIMAKESFADVEVAEAVNESYIAIKVDREELPQIDRYYASLLEAVKGSAGWPITAIINSEGLPIYIDSYLPKENLLTLLWRVNATWETNPEFLLTTAKTIAGLIAEAESQEDNPLAIETAELLQLSRQKIMDALDSEFGGLEGEVKFPHEALLLYQLDELRRAVNPDLEKLVSLQLDSMMTGGIRDAVDGGFHRYSTDGQWKVPHYEKMLYNQALLAQVYLEAWKVFYDDSYRFVAKETLDFAIEYLYREGEGFYSALDADFKGEEGGFYLWSKADIEAAERVAGVSVYQFKPAGELSEANGLLKNVGEAVDARQNQAKERSLSVINEHFEPDFNAAAATQVVFQQPVKFGVLADPQLRGPEMSKALDKLSQQRHRRGELHRDDKVITSWNGLMISSLAFASMAFDSQQYLRIAENLGDLLWNSRFDRPTGRLYRTTDQSQEIFSLEDYAYLARGYVELYDATRDPKWLDRAIDLYHSAKADPALFQSAGSLMATAKSSFDLIDGELISPQVAFLEVELALKNRATDPKLFKVDPADLNNVKSRVFESAINRFSSLRYLNNHLNGSSDNKRFFANGHGQLTVVCTDVSVGVCHSIELQFRLQNHWHINSNRPLQDYLEPTKIESRANLAVEYPEDKVVKLGFQDEPLSLYEGEFTISVTKKTDETAGKVIVNLPLQACNDELCLLPEVHSIVF